MVQVLKLLEIAASQSNSKDNREKVGGLYNKLTNYMVFILYGNSEHCANT